MKQEHELIMLPTNEASNISLHIQSNKPYLNNGEDYETKILAGSHKNQHLHLLSDEEIKEGNWYIDLDLKQIRQAKSIGDGYVDVSGSLYKKIIATTDTSLTTKEWMLKYGKLPLASISESLIKAFIDSQGKLTKVMVEYEGSLKFDKNNPFFQRLKLTPDNTIIWSLVEEKLYTRNEMIEFGKKCGTAGTMAERVGEDYNLLFLQLVEQNL